MRGLTAEEREVMGIATNGDCSRCIGRFPDHLEETVTALTIRGLIVQRVPCQCRFGSHNHHTAAGKLALACQDAVDNLSVEV